MQLPKRTLLSHVSRHLPLLVIVVIAVWIAVVNIKAGTTYSGWDNIMAEFDLTDYARQVFFGAWSDHQGFGAPSAQGQLSEIPRLPILFLLKVLLPDSLIRYAYIFSAYLIGGIGMYVYLYKVWLSDKTRSVKPMLAALGGTLYLLHILTLQQFYISFEMFMAQFAFLPFVLLTIHLISHKLSARNILIFIAVQLLITPSAHTPTIFYLAVLFSQLYGACLMLTHGWRKALWTGFMIGVLTFVVNAYWIIPNVYYSVNNAQYVQESRENLLFGPESVWSIRESSTVANLFKGTHYLFNWKDYSFADQTYTFIFDEWQSHLSQPLVIGILLGIGFITFFGMIPIMIDQSKHSKRWAILLFYVFCLLFIWIDLFPTKYLIDILYKSESFLEAFRNPFTKLSILYSFVSVILFVQVFEYFSLRVLETRFKKSAIRFVLIGSIVISIGLIMYTALPSFQGHFISDKLRIKYPEQYQQMFAFLQTQDRNQRILPLPQLSHAGWEYYDWQFLGKGNGYQGMGFYFFGTPQQVLHRDSDRWVETSDFFYHELKNALNRSNSNAFQEITNKYLVDLVIIDETRIEPHVDHDFTQDHKLMSESGFTKIWELDFLSVYQRPKAMAQSFDVILPEQTTSVVADTQRVQEDNVFSQTGNYFISSDANSSILFPFAQLMQTTVKNLSFDENSITYTTKVPNDDYVLTIPNQDVTPYLVPAAIQYSEGKVSVTFPQHRLLTNNTKIELPKLDDITFDITEDADTLYLFFNNYGTILSKNEIIYPIIALDPRDKVFVYYAPEPANPILLPSGIIDVSNIEMISATEFIPDWDTITKETKSQLNDVDQISVQSIFPVISLDYTVNPSINCADPLRGTISTKVLPSTVLYSSTHFGVNCNGYGFQHLSPAYPYLFRVQGENIRGRGTKLFVNYLEEQIIPEAYLFHKDTFDTVISLPPKTKDPRANFFLNWETRSFNRLSQNSISKMEISPFPTTQFSAISLQNQDPIEILPSASTTSHTKLFDSIHILKIQCTQFPCSIGLNQSYDDMWIGISADTFQQLKHFRLNNWANLWHIEQDGTVIILYLPEIIALSSIGFLLLYGIILIVFTIRRSNEHVKTNRSPYFRSFNAYFRRHS